VIRLGEKMTEPVNEELRRQGLEEALKYELNQVEEAVTYDLKRQMEPRMGDYQTMRRIAQGAGVDTSYLDNRYNSLVLKFRERELGRTESGARKQPVPTSP
jgi:hypothetical protein